VYLGGGHDGLGRWSRREHVEVDSKTIDPLAAPETEWLLQSNVYLGRSRKERVEVDRGVSSKQLLILLTILAASQATRIK
jgi:hypothetical protein